MKVQENNHWITIDIQDYCMSGDKDDLFMDALETFERNEKKLMRETLRLLLWEQFSNEIWKLRNGSGMGLLHSEVWSTLRTTTELIEAGQHVQ